MLFKVLQLFDWTICNVIDMHLNEQFYTYIYMNGRYICVVMCC